MLSLLRGLLECRVMTNDHATALYFNGKNQAAKKRLQKIKAAGLITVKPDGFIRIHEKDASDKFERVFFLEVDRSSEVQETLVGKAGCYLNYYRRGGFAVRNGATRDDFKKFPYRVLMVFKNAERRNNTALRLLQSIPPILTLVYLSTFEEVAHDLTGAIWIRPLDYREATKGTPFAPEKQPRTREYQRQTARELFVEQKVQKRCILANEQMG